MAYLNTGHFHDIGRERCIIADLIPTHGLIALRIEAVNGNEVNRVQLSTEDAVQFAEELLGLIYSGSGIMPRATET